MKNSSQTKIQNPAISKTGKNTKTPTTTGVTTGGRSKQQEKKTILTIDNQESTSDSESVKKKLKTNFEEIKINEPIVDNIRMDEEFNNQQDKIKQYGSVIEKQNDVFDIRAKELFRFSNVELPNRKPLYDGLVINQVPDVLRRLGAKSKLTHGRQLEKADYSNYLVNEDGLLGKEKVAGVNRTLDALQSGLFQKSVQYSSWLIEPMIVIINYFLKQGGFQKRVYFNMADSRVYIKDTDSLTQYSQFGKKTLKDKDIKMILDEQPYGVKKAIILAGRYLQKWNSFAAASKSALKLARNYSLILNKQQDPKKILRQRAVKMFKLNPKVFNQKVKTIADVVSILNEKNAQVAANMQQGETLKQLMTKKITQKGKDLIALQDKIPGISNDDTKTTIQPGDAKTFVEAAINNYNSVKKLAPLDRSQKLAKIFETDQISTSKLSKINRFARGRTDLTTDKRIFKMEKPIEIIGMKENDFDPSDPNVVRQMQSAV